MSLFAERFDILMTLTKVSNTWLATEIGIDPSLVSRFRRGRRRLPKNQNYAELIAKALGEKIYSEAQRQKIAGMICPNQDWPNDLQRAQVLLEEWLSEERQVNQEASMAALLHSFSSKHVPRDWTQESVAKITGFRPYEGLSLAYAEGAEGKALLALEFLQRVIDSPEQRTLYISSDENIDWLRLPGISERWSALMAGVLSMGHRIEIIHSVTRSQDEMFQGLSKWIPVYMLGDIQPYYYPFYKDKVYQRTLWIAGGLLSVTSQSVHGKTRGMLNALNQAPEIVKSYVQEFKNYQALCRPLMDIIPATDGVLRSIGTSLQRMEEGRSARIFRSDTPPFVLLPKSLLQALVTRTGHEGFKEMLRLYDGEDSPFLQRLERLPFHLILSREALGLLSSYRPVRVGMKSYVTKDELFYTPDELRQLYEYWAHLLKRHENFHVYVSDQPRIESQILSSKALMVTVFRDRFPAKAFVMDEPQMINAFWEYQVKLRKQAQELSGQDLKSMAKRLP